MTGGEDMDAFEAELKRRGDALLAGRNFGYPEDYCDPAYDGTPAGFRDVVIPARLKALERSINETFADLLPEGCRFEYAPVEPSRTERVADLVRNGHLNDASDRVDWRAALSLLPDED